MADKCICVKDFEILAAKRLDKNALDYYKSGATDEQTLKENCTAFKSWRFQPQVLRDVSNVNMESSVLGSKIPFPICIAPTAMNKMASHDGEIDSAKAANSLGTGFVLSSWATSSIEEITTNVPDVIRWFQLYVYKDKTVTENLVRRAERNGYQALIVTVDTPLLGKRYQDARNKFALPSNLTLKNFEKETTKEDGFSKGVKSARESGLAEYVASLIDPSLSWKDIDWLKTITDLPIIVKGILTAEMALEAVNHNVAGILVSNHGARQLDGVLPTINALPQVVKAVDGRCEVYLDGGIRNGGDVAKAIALGAKAVFVGRPILWGLACDGKRGAQKVLEILRDEFEGTMKLLGVTSTAELQSVHDLVIHESKILSRL
uniref:hydroxyacid oxidase 1-like n=1 Tax=Styela clava TaxID=7725 RepID=UPI00193A7FA8|nr:hydroxyacid oxidase 1-like [Styela clava]